MPYKRRLTIIAIITYLLLIPLATYFKYFPTIINSEVNNIFIFLLVFLLTLLLVYGAFIIKKYNDVYLLLPQSLIFVFIARALPNLRLSYPPLHDPYYHFVCTLNVIKYGTLKPVLDWWYYGVNTQLHWPDMHLLTTALVRITDIDVMQIFRFQEPLMGIIFFLAVFVLAKTVTKNNGIAILSALFASLSGIMIFYQSEYHPQGLAVILLILLLYAFIKSRLMNDIHFRYVAFIFCIAFTLSHYFTPLFLALIFSGYILSTWIVRFLPLFSSIKNRFHEVIKNTELDYSFLLIVIVSSLVYHFIVYSEPVKNFIHSITTQLPLFAHLIGQPGAPLLTSILRGSKWGLFILAMVSVIWILKTKNINEFRLAVFFACIVLAGVVGNYIIVLPLDRLVGFYTIFTAVFASLTLFRFKNKWFGGIQKNRKVILVTLVASLLIVCGFFNSQTPAYFFKDSGMNTYYWYSNELSSMDKYGITGSWIRNYTSNDSIYVTQFDTLVLPFYYAERPLNNIRVNRYVSMKTIIYTPGYAILNPSKPDFYSQGTFNQKEYLKSTNIIYTNGVIVITRNSSVDV